MAKFRQVHCDFWEDPFFLDMTPEDKYFYIYLLTNPKTTQCGIYELPYQMMVLHTGYSRETTVKLLQRFEQYGKIQYNESTKEIMILNWIKFNWINSPKVKACIAKELHGIKHMPFVHMFLTICKELGYIMDTVSNTVSDTVSVLSGEEEEEREEESLVVDDGRDPRVSNISRAYEQHFGRPANLTQLEAFFGYMDEGMSDEMIVEAFRVARLRGKHIEYALGMIRRLHANGVQTTEQYGAYSAAWQKQKTASDQVAASSSGRAPGSRGRKSAKDKLDELEAMFGAQI